MPNNLLIVPLLAGYLFLHLSLPFKYRAQWQDGYRLLLESAFAGAVLLLLSRITVLALKATAPGFGHWFRRELIPDLPYFGTAAGSLILAIVLPPVLNHLPVFPRPLKGYEGNLFRFLKQQRLRASMDRAVIDADAFTRLLHQTSGTGQLIALTLRSRKWYAGLVAVTNTLEPKELYFGLLPILSGFRDKDTLSVRATTNYSPVYQDEQLDLAPFVVYLRIDEVVDARLFDRALFHQHFSEPLIQSPDLSEMNRWPKD
jgi:hypothetical protein